MKIATLRCLLRNLFSQQPAGNYVEGNVKVHSKHIAVSLSVIANNFLREFQLALTGLITNKAKIVCFPKHHHHRAFIHSFTKPSFFCLLLSVSHQASERVPLQPHSQVFFLYVPLHFVFKVVFASLSLCFVAVSVRSWSNISSFIYFYFLADSRRKINNFVHLIINKRAAYNRD